VDELRRVRLLRSSATEHPPPLGPLCALLSVPGVLDRSVALSSPPRPSEALAEAFEDACREEDLDSIIEAATDLLRAVTEAKGSCS
jgi:hypothetical protein